MSNHTMRFQILAGCFIAAAAFGQKAAPSYVKEISPLLYEKCAMCHRAGEVAPMSLMSYNEVRPWARAIKAKIVSHTMPPWYADGEPGKWANDRRLTQAQIDKVVAWVDAGAPLGSDPVPAPPKFAQGWNGPGGRPPDIIIEAPEMKVPAEGESPWQIAYVKLPFKGDVWVEASQVVPGNRGVVDHVLVTATTLPAVTQLDAEGRVLQRAATPPGDPTARAAARQQPAGDAVPPGIGGFSSGWEPGIDSAI